MQLLPTVWHVVVSNLKHNGSKLLSLASFSVYTFSAGTNFGIVLACTLNKSQTCSMTHVQIFHQATQVHMALQCRSVAASKTYSQIKTAAVQV